MGCWQCLKTHADLVSYRQRREQRSSQFSLVSETLTHTSSFTHWLRMLTPRRMHTLTHTKRNLLQCGCSNKTNADESSFSENLIGVLLLEQCFSSCSGGCWTWHLAVSGFLDKIAEDPVSDFLYLQILFFSQEQPCWGEEKKAAVYCRVPKCLSVKCACCGPEMEEVPSEVQAFCLGAYVSVFPHDDGGETLVDRIEWM